MLLLYNNLNEVLNLLSTRNGKLVAGVEQAMKNWEGKKLSQLPHTIPVCPHSLAAHAFFEPDHRGEVGG